MDLHDRVAIVTGAGSGIGKEIAVELARRGCTVVLVGRRKERLRNALRDVSPFAPTSSFQVCDVSSGEQVEQTVEAVYRRYGRIDVLVNNAGMMIVKTFSLLSVEEFERHMAVNYDGAVRMTRAVVPVMERQGCGAVMNVASVGAELHLPGTSANSASKAALYAFSEALHYELRCKGIHVGVVLPGGTLTELVDGAVRDGLGAYYREQCRKRDPDRALPARVARELAEAVEKSRFETTVPFAEKVFLHFHRAFPGVFRRYMFRRLRPYLG